jgi:hypothetical protein
MIYIYLRLNTRVFTFLPHCQAPAAPMPFLCFPFRPDHLCNKYEVCQSFLSCAWKPKYSIRPSVHTFMHPIPHMHKLIMCLYAYLHHHDIVIFSPCYPTSIRALQEPAKPLRTGRDLFDISHAHARMRWLQKQRSRREKLEDLPLSDSNVTVTSSCSLG